MYRPPGPSYPFGQTQSHTQYVWSSFIQLMNGDYLASEPLLTSRLECLEVIVLTIPFHRIRPFPRMCDPPL